MNIKRSTKTGQFEKGTDSLARKWHPPVIGTKFGMYTIESDLIERSKDNKIKYIVKCECGLVHSVRAYFLETGRQTCCRSCKSKINYKKAIENDTKVGFIKLHHIGVGKLTKTCYSYIKNCAKRRNLLWSDDLTIEYLWELLLKQNKKCALTGLDIDLTEERKNSNIDFEKMTASLDRIDSTKGYTRENIQWVYKDINFMKNNYDQNYFINLCKLVYLNSQDNIEPSTTRSCSEGAETNGFTKRSE